MAGRSVINTGHCWWITIICFLMVSAAPAAVIKGTVTDTLNKAPVESVLVTVKGTSSLAYTNTSGRFTLTTATAIRMPEARTDMQGTLSALTAVTVYGPNGAAISHGYSTELSNMFSLLPDGVYFVAYAQGGLTKAVKLQGSCHLGEVTGSVAKPAAAVTLVYTHKYYNTKESAANEGDTNVIAKLAMWYPDSTNTGVPAGTVLTNYTGTYEVRTNNAVVSGLRVTGAIVVYGNNVIVRNCEVNCSGEIYGIAPAAAYAMSGGAGLKVFNCRVYGTHVSAGVCGGDEIAYCDISGVENSTTGGTNYIHDNYMHDFYRRVAEDQHTDGVQTYGAAGKGGLRVIHNTIIAILTAGDYTPTNYGGGSSAIALCEDMHDLTIDMNYFAGGSYTMYGPSQAGASPANVRVTNNRFSNYYFAKCGEFGTHTGFNSSAPGFTWSGNVWYQTGAAVNP